MHISLDSALGQQRRLNSVGESITQIAPDPAAAYSLRSLTGGDPKVVRVRRASDNHEQDFTASDVSSGALQDFVNAQVVAPLDIQALSATGRDGDFLIAKAAYSLRSLGTRQATLAATGDTVARANGQFVCQVRRDSDDALKSFTATEVTDGTLLAFTNEDVVVYSSDYSSGTDSWAFSGGSLAAPQSIGGEDNALKVTLSGDGFFFPQKTGVLVSGETYSISLKLYAPSDNTNSNLNFNVRESGGGTVLDCNLTEANAWQSFTVSLTSSTTQVFQVTSDVSMTSGDVLYIKDFVVTQTSNSSGFVKTWYDQSVDAGGSAHGNHATQATAANQPKIVNAGSLVTGGLDFDGSDDYFDLGSKITMADGFQVSIVSQIANNGRFPFGDSTSTANWITFQSSTLQAKISGGSYDFSSTRDSSLDLITLSRDASDSLAFFRNSTQLGAAQTATGTNAINRIGARFNEIGPIDGTVDEIIIYDTDQTDNRTAIEANIGEVYSIDLPSGVDPGFDQVDGFVETWYDQSGNGHDVTQATAGSQPKIVNAGALVTQGGKANIDFSSAFLSVSSFTIANASGHYSAIFVGKRGNDSTVRGFWGVQSRDNWGLTNTSGTNEMTVADVNATGYDTTSTNLHSQINDGTDTTIFRDGSQVATGTSNSDYTSQSVDKVLRVGASRTDGRVIDGEIQELIIYNSDETSNRTALETNINSHYSIF